MTSLCVRCDVQGRPNKIRDSLSWYLPRQLTDTEKLISRKAPSILPKLAMSVNMFSSIATGRYWYTVFGSTAVLAAHVLRSSG